VAAGGGDRRWPGRSILDLGPFRPNLGLQGSALAAMWLCPPPGSLARAPALGQVGLDPVAAGRPPAMKVRSGRRGALVLVVLRQWRHPDRAMEVRFDNSRRFRGSMVWHIGFFRRKPNALAPAAPMPVGVVTLLGASLCYLCCT
jgi:hypothetical protein